MTVPQHPNNIPGKLGRGFPTGKSKRRMQYCRPGRYCRRRCRYQQVVSAVVVCVLVFGDPAKGQPGNGKDDESRDDSKEEGDRAGDVVFMVQVVEFEIAETWSCIVVAASQDI